MTPPSRLGALIGILAVLVALAGAGLLAWHWTTDLRARWATLARLTDLASAMNLATELPPPGPLPVADGWGREVERRVTPLGEFLTSAGPDGLFGDLDDIVHVCGLTALGEAFDEQAASVREGGRPDRRALIRAAEEVFGEPVSVEFTETVTFFDASGELLLDVGFDAFGWPRR